VNYGRTGGYGMSLPVSFFVETLQDYGADDRFAIANVDDEVVISLEPRLRRMNELMGVS